MDSVITRSLEKNKVKKRKSPKNMSLKNEYSEFLKKGKSPNTRPKVNKKRVSPNKKISISENNGKNPIFNKMKRFSTDRSSTIETTPIKSIGKL